MTQIVVKSLGTAAIYIAGGIPKNFINDSVVMSCIFGLNRAAVIHDGGLASTLDEAHPWGKVAKDATHAMAWVEPGVSNKWQNGALRQLRAQ